MSFVTGRIIKGIGGFYYVDTDENHIYECRAKGGFRSQKIKPLVGDEVEIEVLDEEKALGNLIKIFPRKNMLIRPATANVDQVLLFFACTNPEPNYIMLDKLMIELMYQKIPIILCFNKADLDRKAEKELEEIYKDACIVKGVSVYEKEGIDFIKSSLKNRTTVLAGPSGVGKSSLLNCLYPKAQMETGQMSKKIQRGRHTTRHSELFRLEKDTYLMDTPGFTSMDLQRIEAKELRFYYPEFERFEGICRFQGCLHFREPDCQVKEALEKGEISQKRYESYRYILEELLNKKKYK